MVLFDELVAICSNPYANSETASEDNKGEEDTICISKGPSTPYKVQAGVVLGV